MADTRQQDQQKGDASRQKASQRERPDEPAAQPAKKAKAK
jgi:hypothetical protein